MRALRARRGRRVEFENEMREYTKPKPPTEYSAVLSTATTSIDHVDVTCVFRRAGSECRLLAGWVRGWLAAAARVPVPGCRSPASL